MTKIRYMSTFALILILPFLIYYPYEAFGWQLDMAFLDPQRWLNSGWVEQGAEVALLTRVVYFLVWSPAVIAGILALLAAARVAWLFRRGTVFDDRVAGGIMWVGRFTMASSGIHILAACLSPMIVSWHNPSGPLPLRFWFSSAHCSLIFCGMAFLLLGAVMREAIKVAHENEEFV
jgi:putative flippase GtrA